MLRREFLTASAAVVAASIASVANAAESGPRQFYELRNYKFANDAKLKAFAAFLGQIAVPAFNRAGIKPVGLFQLMAKDNPAMKLESDPLELWVFLPHESMDSVLGLEQKLATDAAFQDAGKSILLAPKADPAFGRFDSTLLLAMANFPRMATPAQTPTRIFELRTYESPNIERALNKLDMFNAGEFTIFEKVGMRNVFFGGAIAGVGLPQLTYMVMHDDPKDASAHWDAFRKDPDWKVLSAKPEYKDNVSKILDRFVRPLEGSQI